MKDAANINNLLVSDKKENFYHIQEILCKEYWNKKKQVVCLLKVMMLTFNGQSQGDDLYIGSQYVIVYLCRFVAS